MCIRDRAKGVYERNDVPVRRHEGLEMRTGLLMGEVPERVEMRENGILYLVDVMHGQKTGFFLDQKQNRAAIRTVIRKVVWDGVNAHVVLFGVQDDEIAYPEIVAAGAAPCDDGEETEELVPFWDVAYEQSREEGDSPEKPAFGGMAKTPWGTDSK